MHGTSVGATNNPVAASTEDFEMDHECSSSNNYGFQATKRRKRFTNNEGGAGGAPDSFSFQSKENWSQSPFVQASTRSPHGAGELILSQVVIACFLVNFLHDSVSCFVAHILIASSLSIATLRVAIRQEESHITRRRRLPPKAPRASTDGRATGHRNPTPQVREGKHRNSREPALRAARQGGAREHDPQAGRDDPAAEGQSDECGVGGGEAIQGPSRGSNSQVGADEFKPSVSAAGGFVLVQ